jgi:protein-tyrosine phosphatase
MSDPTAIDIATDPLTQRMRGTTRHKNMYFDVPYISQIEGNFYQGGCANGLVLPSFIQHSISLYPWEQYTLNHELKSLSFHWLYDADEEPPKIVHAIADWTYECIQDGLTLLNCQAGLNRSSLVAALVLKRMGRSSEEAIALLREKRSPAVLCNPSFEKWLLTQ